MSYLKFRLNKIFLFSQKLNDVHQLLIGLVFIFRAVRYMLRWQ